MPRSSTVTSVSLDVAEQEEPRGPESDGVFRILVAGDFSAGASRIRQPVPIDRDSFDQVLALFAPELPFDSAGTPARVSFRALEDFHPGHLFEHLAAFEALRALRERIAEGRIASARPPHPVSGADVLREMLGEAPAGAAQARSSPGKWEQMLRDLVKPYTVAKPDPRQPALLQQTDAAISGEMREVMHHRAFQDLEAAWRGVFFLARRLATGENLKIYLLDMTRAAIDTAEGLAAFRRVTEEQPPWSLIAGLYYFAPEEEGALAQIAAIARGAGAPFLGGVALEVTGLAPVFENLRRSPDARWLGLAMPRFLLRLPYSAETDAVEEFAFEEMPAAPEHERYLWGHPAIACAYLLGDAFSRFGWSMRPGMVSLIDGLPLHIYSRDGEQKAKPCAEVLLTEEAAEQLLDRGFMPLVTIKDTDCVRVARFQSMAQPAAPLAGQWT